MPGTFDIQKTISEIRKAAKGGSFISYKELVESYDLKWKNISRRELSRHLDAVMYFCRDEKMPLITANVVQHDTRTLSQSAVEGFERVADKLNQANGKTGQQLVEFEQKKTFEWAGRKTI